MVRHVGSETQGVCRKKSDFFRWVQVRFKSFALGDSKGRLELGSRPSGLMALELCGLSVAQACGLLALGCLYRTVLYTIPVWSGVEPSLGVCGMAIRWCGMHSQHGVFKRYSEPMVRGMVRGYELGSNMRV